MSDFLSRVASAPISRGICEVPGWGAMLPTDRVLREMSGLGMPATELGAPGFLPTNPEAVRDQLADLFERAGATEFVSAVVMDAGWSIPRALGAAEMRHLLSMLHVIDEICAEYGLQQVLHPHVQTVVDPVAFAREAADRVGHVHLKDVDMTKVPALMRREISIMQGVQAGLFTPLGQGDVAIAEVISTLEASGYDGWYVIEQDAAITGPKPDEGHGPVQSVGESLDYLRTVVAPSLAAV